MGRSGRLSILKNWLWSVKAQWYDIMVLSFDVYELIVLVACLVNMLRSLFKLKSIFEDTNMLVGIIDNVFHRDKRNQSIVSKA